VTSGEWRENKASWLLSGVGCVRHCLLPTAYCYCPPGLPMSEPSPKPTSEFRESGRRGPGERPAQRVLRIPEAEQEVVAAADRDRHAPPGRVDLPLEHRRRPVHLHAVLSGPMASASRLAPDSPRRGSCDNYRSCSGEAEMNSALKRRATAVRRDLASATASCRRDRRALTLGPTGDGRRGRR